MRSMGLAVPRARDKWRGRRQPWMNCWPSWRRMSWWAERRGARDQLRTGALERDDGDVVLIGESNDLRLIDDDGLVGFDGEDGGAGVDERVDRADADGRHVEPHILLRLGDFDDGEAALWAKLAGAADAGVGAFDGF